MKRLLTVMVALAVVSQGIARADERVPPGVTVVKDRASLDVRIDAPEAGDRVVVATDEGTVSGDLVDKDEHNMVIDQPLIEGGAERVVVARRQIQSVRYQQSSAHQVGVRASVVVAVALAAAIVLAALGLRFR